MSKYNILLVDDSASIIKALKRSLKDDDYQFFEAASANEAISLTNTEIFDLIICDQNMPNVSGVELLQYLRFKNPEMIRILLTGYNDIEVTKQAVNKCAVYKYFDKPWDDFELKLAVRYALTHKGGDTLESQDSAQA